MEYFTVTLFFAFIALLSLIVKEEPGKRVIYYFLVALVAVMTGLRGMVDEYTRLFVRVVPLSDFFTPANFLMTEKGLFFSFICSTLKSLGFGASALLFLFAIASISIRGYYFRKFTPYYILAFLIYLSHEIFYHDMAGIRMGLASILVLPAIDLAVQGKRGRFLVTVAASGLIHYVGLLSFGLPWLKQQIKTKLLLAGLMLAIVVAYTNVVGNLLKAVAGYNILPTLINAYIVWEEYSYDIGVGHAKTIQQIAMVLFVLFLRGRKPHPSPYFNIVFNTYYVSTLMFILLSDLAMFATRLGGHFYVVEPILLTYLAFYFAEKRIYATALATFALLISYTNYVHRVLVQPYYFYGHMPKGYEEIPENIKRSANKGVE